MLEWFLRGLSRKRVTTGYPDAPEPAPEGFRGRIVVRETQRPAPDVHCPTGAIDIRGGVKVDRARCILCGECVRAAPEHFAFEPTYETAMRANGDASLEHTRQALGDQVRALRRSIHIRHVDAGSDGAEEWEIQALTNPYYDIQRLGLFFTAAPRHADVLLVTGGVTPPMREPLEAAWDAMPGPKALVAAGTDACSGGLAAELETAGGVDRVLPVDVYVPGSPPAPIGLLQGLLLAVGILREAGR